MEHLGSLHRRIPSHPATPPALMPWPSRLWTRAAVRPAGWRWSRSRRAARRPPVSRGAHPRRRCLCLRSRHSACKGTQQGAITAAPLYCSPHEASPPVPRLGGVRRGGLGSPLPATRWPRAGPAREVAEDTASAVGGPPLPPRSLRTLRTHAALSGREPTEAIPFRTPPGPPVHPTWSPRQPLGGGRCWRRGATARAASRRR